MEENGGIFGLSQLNMNEAVEDLETEDAYLIFLGIDCSSSMTPFESIMKEELEKFKEEIGNCSQSDSILISRTNFADFITPTGYKKVEELDTSYQLGSMTVLYDCIIQCAPALTDYLAELKSNGVRAKAVFSIFSDGEDTASKASYTHAKDAIRKLNEQEIITGYMEFGDRAGGMGASLGFRNVITTGGSGSELRGIFGVLTTSIIQFSQQAKQPDDNFFKV